MYTTAVVCIGMQLLLPAFTPDSPRKIDLQYLDDNGNPLWLADGLTPQLRAAAPFAPPRTNLFDWVERRSRAFTAPAPRLPLPAPEFHIMGDERANGRRLTLQIRSPRNAPRVALIFNAPDLAFVRVNGVRPPQQPAKFRTSFAPGWHWVSVRGATEATIEIMLRKNMRIDARRLDVSYGLPPEAAPLRNARDGSVSVPTDLGDTIVVRRRVRL